MSNRESGTVKFFKDDKGYGFITAKSGNEYFVHATQLPPTFKKLIKGQQVTFVAREGKKGMEAAEVQLVMKQGVKKEAAC